MDNSTKGKAVRNLRLPTTDYNSEPIQITPAQQGDLNSRLLKIQLYDNQGNIDLSIYDAAYLSATRVDDELFVADGEIKEDFIYCTLKPSMLAERGKVTCDVTLAGKDINGKDTILTSQTFYLYVAASQLVDNDLVGSENYNILITLIRDVREMERMLRFLESGIHDAEGLRILAEDEREANETVRKSNEAQRITNAQAIATAESGRVQAESDRVTSEQTRVSAENIRLNAESSRVTAEATRVQNETSRLSAESSRVIAEQSRVNAEQNRATAEQNRVNAEQGRVTAENIRNSNEAIRQANETGRQEGFDKITTDVTTAIGTMQTIAGNAKEKAGQATNAANTAVTTSKEAITLSTSATEKSAQAKTTADTAKATANNAVSIAESMQDQVVQSANAASQSAALAGQAETAANTALTQAKSAASNAELARKAAEEKAVSAVKIADSAKAKAASVVERANAGEFKGDTGQDGIGFYALTESPWSTAQLRGLISEIKIGDFVVNTNTINLNWANVIVTPGTIVRVTGLPTNVGAQWLHEHRGVIRGVQGLTGPAPSHEWSGTQVRFQLPNGSWGQWVNLAPLIPVQSVNGRTGAVVISAADTGASPIGHAHSTWNDITDGALPIGRGGTGMTVSPSMLINLGITAVANVMTLHPRPGVTGTLLVSNGGIGRDTLTSNALLTGNGTGAVNMLSNGTSGQFLTSGGTASPTWSTGSLITTAPQSFSGNKTFSGRVIITNTGAGDTTSALEVTGRVRAGSFNTPSDKKLKKKITDIDKKVAYDFISNIKIKSFKFKKKNKVAEDGTHVGVIAQDLLKLNLQGVNYINKEDNGYLSVKESKLIYPLISYCQELEKRIKELEKR